MIEEVRELDKRCQAEIVDKWSRDYRRHATPGDMICQRAASYKIDGCYYCGQHAGTIAIKILLAERKS